MSDEAERWLTYAEAGELLGISPEAARQLARRCKWPRRTRTSTARLLGSWCRMIRPTGVRYGHLNGRVRP